MATRGNGRDSNSFQEHIERMRTFNQTHSGMSEMMDSSAGKRTCRVNLTISKTGGSATPTGTEDWLDVVPMWKMALSRFSPN